MSTACQLFTEDRRLRPCDLYSLTVVAGMLHPLATNPASPGRKTISLRETLDHFPEGAFDVEVGGRRYGAAKTVFAGGRSLKFEAWERGGGDYISLNLYCLADGRMLLKPCEMPEEKVRTFILNMMLLPVPPA